MQYFIVIEFIFGVVSRQERIVTDVVLYHK